MEVMKQALAFPMYGAAAWLLWVVSQEAGSVGVLVTAAGAGPGRIRGVGTGARLKQAQSTSVQPVGSVRADQWRPPVRHFARLPPRWRC